MQLGRLLTWDSKRLLSCPEVLLVTTLYLNL